MFGQFQPDYMRNRSNIDSLCQKVLVCSWHGPQWRMAAAETEVKVVDSWIIAASPAQSMDDV